MLYVGVSTLTSKVGCDRGKRSAPVFPIRQLVMCPESRPVTDPAAFLVRPPIPRQAPSPPPKTLHLNKLDKVMAYIVANFMVMLTEEPIYEEETGIFFLRFSWRIPFVLFSCVHHEHDKRVCLDTRPWTREPPLIG